MKELLFALQSLKEGGVFRPVPADGNDDFAVLSRAINALGISVQQRVEELSQLLRITEKINSGLLLEQVLDEIYDSLKTVIPYHRIGVSFLEKDGRIVTSFWNRSDVSEIKLAKGYAAVMAGSSLQKIIETGQPRILNDLPSYLKEHPRSDSTRRVVEEGMCSSLTCPLVVSGKPIGFVFFSHKQRNAYQNVHIEVFREIAGQLSLAIEKSRLYERVVFQNEELKRLDKVKSDFVTIVSHELRTPLAIVTEGMSLVIDGIAGPVTTEQKDLLMTAKQFVTRLTMIINDFLDISKIEAGRLDLRRTLTDAKKLLTDLIVSFQKIAEPKKITIELQFPANDVVLYVDADKIIQVFTNLLSNAVKFTPPNGNIHIALNPRQQDFIFTVKDSGIGISLQDQSKLFQKFQQFNRHDGPGIKGTGLGLAISKALVELHEGQIWAESEPEQGSTFSVLLPGLERMKKDFELECQNILNEAAVSSLLVIRFANLESVSKTFGADARRQVLSDALVLLNKTISHAGKRIFPYEEDCIFILQRNADKTLANSLGRQAKDSIAKHNFIFNEKRIDVVLNWGVADSSLKPKTLSQWVEFTKKEILKPKTVLVVDDNAELVEILKKRLSLRGYMTQAAFDGVQGLEAVKQSKPDFIILDIDMPRMNGYEVLGRLKENPATASIPVILLTAFEVDIDKMGKTGSLAVPVVQKTESFEKVVALVDNLI